MSFSKQERLELLYQQAFSYNGYKVMSQLYPLNTRYLERIEKVFHHALHDHPRTFAFKITLHLPIQLVYDTEELMKRFIASLRAKIVSDRERCKKDNPKAHRCTLRYVWVREFGELNRGEHYHVALFLNGDAYRSVGKFELGRDNLYNKVLEAWASALGIELSLVVGLVHFDAHSNYLIHQDDNESIQRCFYHFSYLAKRDTKHISYQRSFGASLK